MDHLYGLVDDRCVAKVGVLPARSLSIDQISSHFDSDALIPRPVPRALRLSCRHRCLRVNIVSKVGDKISVAVIVF